MTVRTRSYLRGIFANGDTPSGGDFADLFDSFASLSDANSMEGAFNVRGSAVCSASAIFSGNRRIVGNCNFSKFEVSNDYLGANAVVRSFTTSLSAAGSAQGTATLLNKRTTIISHGQIGQGVRIPAASIGEDFFVYNQSGSNLKIYPATGISINGRAVDSPIDSSAGVPIRLIQHNATDMAAYKAQSVEPPIGNPPTRSLLFDGSAVMTANVLANFPDYDRSKFSLAGAFRIPTSVSADIIGRPVSYGHFSGSNNIFRGYVSNAMGLVFRGLLTSAGAEFSIATSAGFIVPNTWYSYLFQFDGQNETQSERVKLWVNGQRNQPNYTFNSTAPINIFFATGGSFYMSQSDTSFFTNPNNGALIYQPCMFSGRLVPPTSVFNGLSGKMKQLSNQPNCFSLLDASASATNDAIKGLSVWVNNGTTGVVTTAAVP